ncbi:TIGR01906 family membrane protein [Anaerosporobacter faecicola]|uniref:TIGR01906 family membrane protein n=1 Tax=Anaerosporobacter faecicola TaxID=2718714 RepID=UPI00143B41E9|nr:TIGR01906 family membrane protein [Anaerosporobacter faecicola]
MKYLQNKWSTRITNILIGVLFTLFFISISVIIILNTRSLYYKNINQLEIQEYSGLDRQTIIENYDALIDYCSPFYHGELNFPSLPASPSGLSHFAETKVIFVSFYYVAAITGILLLGIIMYKKKRHDTSYLRTSAITIIVLPLLFGLATAINFDKTFLLFHKIAFRNDDWLFDPATDPIINLLPEEYFMYCAIGIVLLVILGSLILFLIDRLIRKQKKVSI